MIYFTPKKSACTVLQYYHTHLKDLLKHPSPVQMLNSLSVVGRSLTHGLHYCLFMFSFWCCLYRKNILKFLDAERDISVLKGNVQPGDIIHYVFDRERTMNISENLYRLLPSSPPLKKQHFKRCAIVGNSGILLNSGCGAEIDSHDFVIR